MESEEASVRARGDGPRPSTREDGSAAGRRTVSPARATKSAERVELVVVDDDSMVRTFLRLALEESEFRVAGEAGSAEEALELVARRRPGLLLVDLRLPDGLGVDLVRDLRRTGVDAPAVVMTANLERGLNELAREAGAQGSVLKSGSVDELLAALRAVRAGRESFDPRHPRRPAGQRALSPRERDVLRLVANGATNREIAAALGVGGETVKTLLARSFAKLGVRRRAEAVAAAHELGIL